MEGSILHAVIKTQHFFPQVMNLQDETALFIKHVLEVTLLYDQSTWSIVVSEVSNLYDQIMLSEITNLYD